jgi:hypothetical protein
MNVFLFVLGYAVGTGVCFAIMTLVNRNKAILAKRLLNEMMKKGAVSIDGKNARKMFQKR